MQTSRNFLNTCVMTLSSLTSENFFSEVICVLFVLRLLVKDQTRYSLLASDKKKTDWLLNGMPDIDF